MSAEAIVLSLGVDAAAADPESPLQVTADAYRAAGELVGQLGPVAAIQEGGYDLPSLGEYVLAALAGAAGRTAAGQLVNALLALAASALWGTSDFGGGLMSRRLDPSAAVLISQATGAGRPARAASVPGGPGRDRTC